MAALATPRQARDGNRRVVKILLGVMAVLMAISVLTILIKHHYYLG